MDVETDFILDVSIGDGETIDDIEMLGEDAENELLKDEEPAVDIKCDSHTPCHEKDMQQIKKERDISEKVTLKKNKRPEMYDIPIEKSASTKYNHRKAVEIVKTKDMFSNKLIDYKRLNRHLDVTKKTDPRIAGREIAYRLQEPKIELMRQVVRVLGVELCMEIFEETKNIVNSGGLKTDAGDRRRSPGGTFLYVLKNRGYATNRQVKEIFKVEDEKKKLSRKKEARKKRVKSKHALKEKKIA